MRIYWPYGLVDNCVRDRCYTTSSLNKTDTSLRRTVEAGPEGVRLREVWLYITVALASCENWGHSAGALFRTEFSSLELPKKIFLWRSL